MNLNDLINVFSAVILFYGDSGDGKTTLLAAFIKAMRTLYPGAKARLYTCDNWEALRPYQDAGILDVWQLNRCIHPFEAVNFAAKGYWVDNVHNPNPKYIAPTDETFKVYRLFLFEGLSTWSDILMLELANKLGQGARIGPGTRPGEDGISFKDGQTPVGSNTQTHYNLAQRQIHARVLDTGVLPGLKIWTSHQVKATEDGRPVFGPQAAGKALTPQIQRWFDHVGHLHTVSKGSSLEFRVYLREHEDPKVAPGIPFKAVTRLPANLVSTYKVPEYLVSGPDTGLDYLKLLSDIKQQSINNLLNL